MTPPRAWAKPPTPAHLATIQRVSARPGRRVHTTARARGAASTPSRSRSRSRSRGFTLIEVLLAITILATIMGVITASTMSMFNTRELLQLRYERSQMANNALDRMARELAMAYMAGPEHGGEDLPDDPREPLTADDPDAQRRGERVKFGFIGRKDSVHFTSFAYVRTQPNERASHHAEIGYTLRANRDSGALARQLVRREDTSLDSNLERGGNLQVMLPEIERLELEYWDAGPVRLGTMEEIAEGRWVKDWDTTRREHSGRLPTRVRIRLTLPPLPGQRDSEVFMTQTQIGTSEVLEF